MNRFVLHCDLNNFYASVETLLNPSLTGVPIAVSGRVDKRHGVVLAKNELAKAKGVKTGDVVWEALKKEPNLIIVESHFDRYNEFSKKVFNLYTNYTPLVEPFGADECWLDVTGCVKSFSEAYAMADAIRKKVKETFSLTISAGVSFNKVFAKLASDLEKPDAVTMITKDNFKELIWPLPASNLLMVGKKTAEKLRKMNIKTIGDIAAADESSLKSTFGINGIKLRDNALGLDAEPVRSYVESRELKSIGHGMTAVRDITTAADMESVIFFLSDKIAQRLRKHNVYGCGVAVDLRSNELRSESRQQLFNYSFRNSTDIGSNAMKVVSSFWNGNPPVRTVTVRIYDLSQNAKPQQLGFFENSRETEKNDSLDMAIDKIRNKFGSSKIIRANIIEKDFIYDKIDDEDFLPFKR